MAIQSLRRIRKVSRWEVKERVKERDTASETKFLHLFLSDVCEKIFSPFFVYQLFMIQCMSFRIYSFMDRSNNPVYIFHLFLSIYILYLYHTDISSANPIIFFLLITLFQNSGTPTSIIFNMLIYLIHRPKSNNSTIFQCPLWHTEALITTQILPPILSTPSRALALHARPILCMVIFLYLMGLWHITVDLPPLCPFVLSYLYSDTLHKTAPTFGCSFYSLRLWIT